jgi:hypothetical protein
MTSKDAEQTVTNVMTGTDLPSKYGKYGVERGFKAPELHRITMIMLAYSGLGKTTFAMSIPDALVLTRDEDAASSVVGGRAYRVVVQSLSEYKSLLGDLVADGKAGKSPFKLVVFDTIDDFAYDLFAQQVIQRWNDTAGKKAQLLSEVGSSGRGYGDLAGVISKDLQALSDANYGWLCTGHLRDKTVGDSLVTRPVLSDAPFTAINRKTYARFGLQKQVKKMGKDEKGKVVALPKSQWEIQRLLTVTTDNPADEVKMRMPKMEDVIRLPQVGGWDVLKERFDAAAKVAAEEDAQLRKAAETQAKK